MNLAKTSYRRRIQWRNARLRYWRRLADQFLALGLTTRGTVRKNEQHPYVRGFTQRQRKNARQRIYRGRLAENGFTTRGRSIWTPLDRAWRQLRQTIQLPTANLDTTDKERWVI